MILLLLALTQLCYGNYPGTIYGPDNVNDSIAIVGSTESGLHMALKLKDKGFKNITIYEMQPNLGGLKYTSHTQGGSSFHLFSTILSDDKILKELADKYLAPEDVFEAPPMTIWSEIKGEFSEMSVSEYIIQYVMNMHQLERPAAIQKFTSDLQTYITLFQSVFPGGDDFGIYKEPSWEAKLLTKGSLTDFLRSQNLLSLFPIFILRLSANGFGHPDDIPALIGLMKVLPETISPYESLIKRGTVPASLKSYVIKGGYAALFNALTTEENINIRFNEKVDRIHRDKLSRKPRIQLRIRPTVGDVFWKSHDFLVWTPNLRESLQPMSWDLPIQTGPAVSEYQNFLRVKKNTYKHSVVFDSELIRRGGTPINVLIDEIVNKGEGVSILYDAYAINNRQNDPDTYRSGGYPFNAEGTNVSSIQAIQYTNSRIKLFDYFSNIENHFQPVNVSFDGYNVYPMNPMFSAGDITNSMIWKIIQMQGNYGMWYTGSSAIHESVELKFAYDVLLTNKMGSIMKDGNDGGNDGNDGGNDGNDGGDGGNVIA